MEHRGVALSPFMIRQGLSTSGSSCRPISLKRAPFHTTLLLLANPTAFGTGRGNWKKKKLSPLQGPRSTLFIRQENLKQLLRARQ